MIKPCAILVTTLPSACIMKAWLYEQDCTAMYLLVYGNSARNAGACGYKSSGCYEAMKSGTRKCKFKEVTCIYSNRLVNRFFKQ